MCLKNFGHIKEVGGFLCPRYANLTTNPLVFTSTRSGERLGSILLVSLGALGGFTQAGLVCSTKNLDNGIKSESRLQEGAIEISNDPASERKGGCQKKKNIKDTSRYETRVQIFSQPEVQV